MMMLDALGVAPPWLPDASGVDDKDAANEALEVAVLLSSAPPLALLQAD